MSELMRPRDAADRLKITQRQVYRLIEAGVLKGTRIPGTKTVRVFVDSVEDVIKQGATDA